MLTYSSGSHLPPCAPAAYSANSSRNDISRNTSKNTPVNKWKLNLERLRKQQPQVIRQQTTQLLPKTDPSIRNTHTKLAPINSQLNSYTPPQRSKWSTRGDPKVVAQSLRRDLLSNSPDSEDSTSDADEVQINQFVDYYDSTVDINETIKVETASIGISTEGSWEYLQSQFVERINTLETQLKQSKISKHENEEKLKSLSDLVLSKPLLNDKSHLYFVNLLVIDWLRDRARNDRTNSNSIQATIIQLENHIHVLPDTMLHKSNQDGLDKLLKAHQFGHAKAFLMNIFKKIPQIWLSNRVQASFHHVCYLMDYFMCVKAIQERQPSIAYRIIQEQISSHKESNNGIFESKEKLIEDYNRLGSFLAERYPEYYSPDIVRTSTGPLVLWDWNKKLSEFWNDTLTCFYANYGYRSDVFPPLADTSPCMIFVAAFCVDRMEALRSSPEYHYNTPVPQNLLNVVTLSQQLYQFKHILSETSPTTLQKYPSKQTIQRIESRRKLPEIITVNSQSLQYKKAQSAPVVSKVEDIRVPRSNEGPQLEWTEIADRILIPYTVELSDTIEISRDKFLVALVGKEKKEINFWMLHKQVTGNYSIAPYFTHQTKRPPGCIAFYKTGVQVVFCYSEYNHVVLFDVEKRTVLCRQTEIHRNVILGLEILPEELQDVQGGRGVYLISLGFDNSLKISLVSMSEHEEVKIIDRVHGSSAQGLTAFAFRKDSNGKCEIIVSTSSACFRVYRIKHRGHLQLVKTVTIESLRHIPMITRIVAHPVHDSIFAATAERDNRIFLVDFETGAMVRQFSARLLSLDKRSDVAFSPCGNYLTCGSLSLTPRPPQTTARPSRTFNRSHSTTITPTTSPITVLCWSVDGKMIPTSTHNVAVTCHWYYHE